MAKILIITEGGKDIGFGHVARCTALYQAFSEKGIKPNFIVNGDDGVLTLLNHKESEIFNWIRAKDKLFGLLKGSSIVIIDSYLADFEYYEKISQEANTPVYIDDNKRFDYPKGYVVNGSVYAEDLDYPQEENNAYLLGPQYSILRKEFWGDSEKRMRDKVESIMISFGGSDGKNMTPKIMKFLNEIYPDLIKNVIIGSYFRNIDEIIDLKDGNTNLIHNPDGLKMRQVMLESDLAISAGGQILYELARIGVPAVGICTAENQRQNLQKWRALGFIENAGAYDDKNLTAKLSESLSMVFSYNERVRRFRIGNNLVDGNGARRIIRSLLN